MPLDIAFFGSSLVSAYWNGAATYYRGIIRALARRGHRVTFYEPDAYGRQEHRDIADPPWARVVVYEGQGSEGVERALESARSADLLVKASGIGVFDPLLERAVLDVRRADALVVFWDVDAPATLDRVEQDPGDPFRALIPKYDLIFTSQVGTPIIPRNLTRHFKRALEKAVLPSDIRFHDLRHRRRPCWPMLVRRRPWWLRSSATCCQV